MRNELCEVQISIPIAAHQSLGVVMIKQAAIQSGKIQHRFVIKHTWKMEFVLSSMVCSASRKLCEAKDVAFNNAIATFQNIVKKWDFVPDILDSVSRSTYSIGHVIKHDTRYERRETRYDLKIALNA